MNDVTPVERNAQIPSLAARSQYMLLGLALLVVLALFVGVPFISSLFAPTPPPAAKPAADGSFQPTEKQWATLKLETVKSDAFATLVATDGKIAVDDDRTTQVFSPFTGQITHIYAKMGDRVRAGAALFAIRASEFVQGQSDLVTAQGSMQTARAQLHLTQAAEARQHDLYSHQGAALKDWEQSQVDLTNAQAGLRNAENAVVSVKNRLRILGRSDAEIEALSHRRANASRAETVVRAPVAGVVTQRLIGVGQNISGTTGGNGSTQAFAISDFSTVWVVGNLREEDAMKAHVGQSATVRLLAQPDTPYHTRINYVAPMLDPASRRIAVRALLSNADGRLKPEMFASFALQTGNDRISLAVPESAVIYEGTEARVWVARMSDKSVLLRKVTVGATVDGRVEIVSGLSAGETVVTSGALFIDRAAKGDQ